MDSIEIVVYCQPSSVSVFSREFPSFYPHFFESSAGFLEATCTELVALGHRAPTSVFSRQKVTPVKTGVQVVCKSMNKL